MRRAVRRVNGSIIAALFLSACGQEPTTDGSPSPTETPVETTTPTLTETETSPSPQSLLRKRDVAPGGLETSFSYIVGGDGICDPDQPSPAIDPPTELQIGRLAKICLHGFGPDPASVSITLTLPDGTVRDESISDFDVGLEFMSLPGDPVGGYFMRATQDGIEATASFPVVRADSPRLVIFPPSTGRAGSTFRVGLAGFPAEGAVPLFLYLAEDERFQCNYLAQLPSARTDGNGEAVYDLSTLADDPPGTYCVHFRGGADRPEDRFGIFTVTTG